MLLYGGGLRLLEALRLRIKDLDFERREITVREGKGDKDKVTTMIYTHVRNRGGRGVRSPADGLARHPDDRWAETAYHAVRAVTTKQAATRIRLTTGNHLRVRLQVYRLRGIGGNFL